MGDASNTHNVINESMYCYRVSNIPPDIFSSVRCTNALLRTIDSIQRFQAGLDHIDNVYKKFIESLHTEMDDKLSRKQTLSKFHN